MNLYLWFINVLLPLFIDNFGNNVLISNGDFILTDLNIFNIIFCFNLTWVLVSVFIIFPYKYIKHILKFDKKGR